METIGSIDFGQFSLVSQCPAGLGSERHLEAKAGALELSLSGESLLFFPLCDLETRVYLSQPQFPFLEDRDSSSYAT